MSMLVTQIVHNYDVPMVEGVDVRRKVSGYLNTCMDELQILAQNYDKEQTDKTETALYCKLSEMLIKLELLEDLKFIRKRCSNEIYQIIGLYQDKITKSRIEKGIE